MASRIGGICSPFVVFLVSCVGSKYFRLVELELDDTRVPPGEWGGGTTPYNGLYGEAPPERGTATFFRL